MLQHTMLWQQFGEGLYGYDVRVSTNFEPYSVSGLFYIVCMSSNLYMWKMWLYDSNFIASKVHVSFVGRRF